MIHRLLRGEVREETLENAREHLTRMLLKFGSYRHPIMVYYDARINPPVGARPTQKIGGYIENIFVPSADEAIRVKIRKTKDRGSLSVVSHDREVYGYAASMGVRVVRVVDFLERLEDEEVIDFDPLEPPEKYGL